MIYILCNNYVINNFYNNNKNVFKKYLKKFKNVY